jgi:hypothetical protein
MTVHTYRQGRHSLGSTPIGNRPMYGTTATCTCGQWETRNNETPSGKGSTQAKEAWEQHVTTAAGSIRRERVTWVRWDPRRMKNVTSHPWQWIWTDPTGTERAYDTKHDAIDARGEWE